MKAENIEVRQDVHTKMFYATCYVRELGEIMQWGTTHEFARLNLKTYVVDVLHNIEWPEGE